MELSDEQYDQVLRYTDGEMNPTESKAFEAILIHNAAISNEAEFYKEIRTIVESADKKICNINEDTSEEKTGADEVSRMIKQARANWENRHENDWRQEHGMPLRELKGNHSQKHYDIIEINDEPESGSEKGNFNRSLKEEHKVKRIYLFQWLAAAVLIGFVCIGVTFQYLRNKNADQGIVYNTKEPNSKVAAENKNPGSQKKNNIPDTTSSQVNSSASDDASSHNSTAFNKVGIEKAEREKLADKNFEPDNLPAHIPAPLEDPSAFYKDRKPEKAIQEYKNLLADIKDAENPDLEARGEDNEIELIAFYAHYYLAQSYMSVNNMTNAIQELGKAMSKAPDKIWKNRVQWYMALAFLKTGQIQRAETLFKEVANNREANDYKQRAIKLVDELKKD